MGWGKGGKGREEKGGRGEVYRVFGTEQVENLKRLRRQKGNLNMR